MKECFSMTEGVGRREESSKLIISNGNIQEEKEREETCVNGVDHDLQGTHKFPQK